MQETVTPTNRNRVVITHELPSESLLDKFEDLLQSIFSAEDSLESLQFGEQTHFLPSYSARSARLESNTIRSLTKLLVDMGTSKAGVQLSDKYELSQLQRLLKLLERNIQAAADCAPVTNGDTQFSQGSTTPTPKKGKGNAGTAKKSASTKTKKRKKKAADSDEEEYELLSDGESYVSSATKSPRGRQAERSSPRQSSRSRSASESHSPEETEEEASQSQKTDGSWSANELARFQENLRTVQGGFLAVGCCMALWTCAKLPKQVSLDIVPLTRWA